MKIKIGLSLALSGRYAPMGRQAEAAIRLFVRNTNAAGGVRLGPDRAEVELECLDDQSDPARCADIYRTLCGEKRVDLLLGPYASDLTAKAAPIADAAEMVFINHGGAADSLYEHGYRMIVGVPAPASNYLIGFVHLVAALKFWRKRVAIIAQKSPFARAVAAGIERAAADRFAKRHGLRVRVKWNGRFDPDRGLTQLSAALRRNRVNALVSAGSYEHDLTVMRAITADRLLNIPVLACVAAGVARFRDDLGENAEGIVGPSPWEEDAPIVPTLGPTPREFAREMRSAVELPGVDYVAAQLYAASMIAGAALEAAGSLNQSRLREALARLRVVTMLGQFEIDPASGRQLGHRPHLIQWLDGRKIIIETETSETTGSLRIPPGWRLIAAGIDMLRLDRDKPDPEEPGPIDDERKQLDDREKK